MLKASSSNQTLLAVNSTEWLNLCARGSIRMNKRRPVIASTSPTSKEMERVFASAPFTKLSSSVDLFVLNIKDDWAKDAPKHRAHPSEVLTLALSDVVSHHCVTSEHLPYYENLGAQCGVHLSTSTFESDWMSWVLSETFKSSIEAAEFLQSAFGISKPLDANKKEIKTFEKYKWEEIAKLVIRPNEQIKAKPGHIETLLSGVREIADAVSSTRDSEQFYIACAIEWIELRTGKDPMKKKLDRVLLSEVLANAKEKPIDLPSTETQTVLERLVAIHPKAFTADLSPVTIAFVIRLLTESRTKKLQPGTVVQIFNSVDKDSLAANLLSLLLATSLGIELTNKLVYSFSHVDLMDMNWEVTN